MGQRVQLGGVVSTLVTTPLTYWGDVLTGVRNLDGTYTAAGKAALIAQEAADLVKASGGDMTQADAVAQATNDVTASLTGSNADPSQGGSLVNDLGIPNFPGGSTGLLIAGGVIVAVLLLRR